MVKARDLLLDEETLFKDENVFTPAHVPEDFIHRDAQIKELSLSLKPGLRGVNPANTLMHGPPSTGKTTAIKHMFDEIGKISGKLVTVYISCEDSNTRFNIFSKIHEAVYGHSPPETGKPLEGIKEKIFNKLAREGKSLVVALDELDYLFLNKTADKVLVDLLKSYDTYGYDKVGIIAIMIDEGYLEKLNEKTRSVFTPKRIFFNPYNRDEIKDILSVRVKYGFYDSVMPEEAVDYIVDQVMNKGDLRYGINAIRQSGYLAERDSSRSISIQHVTKACEGDEAGNTLKALVDVLDDREKNLLKIIATLKDTSSGKVFEVCQRDTGTGIKKYNEIIAKFEHLKLVDTSYVEGKRGRSRTITLRFDREQVRKILG